MTKKALLIGINYYATPENLLNGCINDVINVRNMLIDAYDYDIKNITVLRDDLYPSDSLYPSSDNIIRELENIIVNSESNDEIWIHYSGHGLQSPSSSYLNETDKKDELIITVNINGNYASLGAITDNEIHNILKKNNNEAKIFIMFDCCNSGTLADLRYTYRFEEITKKTINENIKFIVKEKNILPKQITDASTLNKTSNESDKYTVKKYTENENCSLKNIYMISGSKDEQNAYDYFDSNNKISMGALTASFLTQLRKAKHNIYLSELHKNICQDLINKSFIDQTPCYSTSEEKENSDYVFDKNAKSVSNNKKISGKHTFYFNY